MFGERRAPVVRGEKPLTVADVISAAPPSCPTCGSPQPHLHPAVQFEGEVQPCLDAFHRTVTPQNTPERIAAVDRVTEALG